MQQRKNNTIFLQRRLEYKDFFFFFPFGKLNCPCLHTQKSRQTTPLMTLKSCKKVTQIKTSFYPNVLDDMKNFLHQFLRWEQTYIWLMRIPSVVTFFLSFFVDCSFTCSSWFATFHNKCRFAWTKSVGLFLTGWMDKWMNTVCVLVLIVCPVSTHSLKPMHGWVRRFAWSLSHYRHHYCASSVCIMVFVSHR